jgi:ferredoxin
MPLLKTQSAGGKATAIIFRKQALDRYYENPNQCKQCDEIIHVNDGQKIRQAKLKKFCTKSCAVTYNNLRREKKVSEKKKITNNIIRFDYLIGHTIESLIQSRNGNWKVARAQIQTHARQIYLKSNKCKECVTCNYSRHIEVCHIKAVKDFQKQSNIIEEVNNINNLIALCPTHHWEFDNGFLKIK